jgi:5-methylcytosine-specific restriction endonuclease McrA
MSIKKKHKQAREEYKDSIIRKLKIIYGEWWKYYCSPQEIRDVLYDERECCPYCGDKLPSQYVRDNPEFDLEISAAHIDHMDPLTAGGEDSIRNAVYVCMNCNLLKGKRLFVDWLQMLNPKQREISRKIYEEKHGCPPESFIPGEPNSRSTGVSYELCFSEEELKKQYPKPKVDGPPVKAAVSIVLSSSENERP